MTCQSCGQSENPQPAPVVGPAIILGNGAVVPFESDAAAESYLVRKGGPGSDPMIIVLEGDIYT